MESATGISELTPEGIAALVDLARRNEELVQESKRRIDDYEALVRCLGTLQHRTHHRVLAPLCGGLAYLEGELTHTNELIVLLGDNWFAERSASEATAIAQRRLDFLKSEQQKLKAEMENITTKQKLLHEEQLLSEGVSAQAFECGDEAAGIDLSDDLTLEELAELEEEIGPEVFDDAVLEKKIIEFKARRRGKQQPAKKAQEGGTSAAPVQPKFVNPSEIFDAFSMAPSAVTSAPEQSGATAAHGAGSSQSQAQTPAQSTVIKEGPIKERDPTVASASHAAQPKKKRSLFWQDQSDGS